MKLDVPEEARRLLEEARVARLATADAGGRPHVVPVVFAFTPNAVYLPIDHKPKRRSDPRALRRVRNLEANPRAALLVDHYEEDWDRLRWVRVDGRAELVDRGPAYRDALAALAAKYPQYRANPLPPEGAGLVILLRPESLRAWSP